METYRFAPPYELPVFPFEPPPELRDGPVIRHPIVIAGAGLAGLALACDLARRGVRCVLLDDDDTVGVRGASSRGICYAQKTLEILDRLGVAERVVDKGVTWTLGRTFSRDAEVYRFTPDPDRWSAQPPFVNLQQFYLEWFLVDRIRALGMTDLRWKNRVSDVQSREDCVRLAVDTPAGGYTLEAGYLVDATGANSPIRDQFGLETHTSRSADRWCITDVRFKDPLPVERWTWVDAPFNEGRSVWQHLMADDVWRMDYQMDGDADPEEVSRPEVAGSRLRRQLGPDVDFEFVWIGPYQYRDHLLDSFRHGRVFFIGDSAHVVSPFGARGGNSGIQDAANLGWKLALVTAGLASDRLLDSYDVERRAAAVENLRVTSRTARFLAPRSAQEHRLRRAVVDLACRYAFARALVNTGRMSVANDYPPSDWLPAGGRSVPNLLLRLADGRQATLLSLFGAGARLLALWFDPPPEGLRALRAALGDLPVDVLAVGTGASAGTWAGAESAAVIADDGRLAKLLDAGPGRLALLRPDAYLATALDAPTADDVRRAVRIVLGAA